MFDEAFPQDKQIGGSHYQHYLIQPYEFISKNELTFFQFLNRNSVLSFQDLLYHFYMDISKHILQRFLEKT